MARTQSPKRHLGRLERGFEFSRLTEEWMAQVYDLIVQLDEHVDRLQLTPDAAGGNRRSHQLADHDSAGGNET